MPQTRAMAARERNTRSESGRPHSESPGPRRAELTAFGEMMKEHQEKMFDQMSLMSEMIQQHVGEMADAVKMLAKAMPAAGYQDPQTKIAQVD